jgi:hypothetical protein
VEPIGDDGEEYDSANDYSDDGDDDRGDACAL